MNIGIVTPAPPESLSGNRITATRWARILRALGHRVVVVQRYRDEPFDILIALHARQSSDFIRRFVRLHPKAPVIVALTGTDLYRDLNRSRKAPESLNAATRIVALQPKALDELQSQWRRKTRIVHQSVRPFSGLRRPSEKSFDVCVVGHLRPVKDPFRAAMAARLLPESSRIRVIQFGAALSIADENRARREMKLNGRYRWFGLVSPSRVRSAMLTSRLFVISSLMEGGANALGEAIVAGLPVLASRIPGSIGILGNDYGGYFGCGETEELSRLMLRCETEPEFLAHLTSHCNALSGMFDPAIERAAWADLLDEVR